MIVHCETCKIDLLESESDRKALDAKDCHEFEHLHPVNLYAEHRDQGIRVAGMIGPFDVDT
jgi:hypothetical protein